VLQGPTVQLRIGLDCTKEIVDLYAGDPELSHSFIRGGSARRFKLRNEHHARIFNVAMALLLVASIVPMVL